MVSIASGDPNAFKMTAFMGIPRLEVHHRGASRSRQGLVLS
jgi:hypothetical protein